MQYLVLTFSIVSRVAAALKAKRTVKVYMVMANSKELYNSV